MESKKLTPKKSKELPFNYSLYPVEEIPKEDLSEKVNPIEYCEVYNATLFVRKPYKKIIEY